MSSLLGGSTPTTSTNLTNTGTNINNNSVSATQPITPFFTLTNVNNLPSNATNTPVAETSANQVNFATPSLSGNLNTSWIVFGIVIILIVLYFILR